MKECIKEWLLKQMPEMDDNTLGAIYEEYRDSAVRLWGDLKANVSSGGDPVAADRLAHTLKGSAATVGDNAVFEVVQGWREAVKAGDTARAGELWVKIEPLIEAI